MKKIVYFFVFLFFSFVCMNGITKAKAANATVTSSSQVYYLPPSGGTFNIISNVKYWSGFDSKVYTNPGKTQVSKQASIINTYSAGHPSLSGNVYGFNIKVSENTSSSSISFYVLNSGNLITFIQLKKGAINIASNNSLIYLPEGSKTYDIITNVPYNTSFDENCWINPGKTKKTSVVTSTFSGQCLIGSSSFYYLRITVSASQSSDTNFYVENSGKLITLILAGKQTSVIQSGYQTVQIKPEGGTYQIISNISSSKNLDKKFYTREDKNGISSQAAVTSTSSTNGNYTESGYVWRFNITVQPNLTDKEIRFYMNNSGSIIQYIQPPVKFDTKTYPYNSKTSDNFSFNFNTTSKNQIIMVLDNLAQYYAAINDTSHKNGAEFAKTAVLNYWSDSAYYRYNNAVNPATETAGTIFQCGTLVAASIISYAKTNNSWGFYNYLTSKYPSIKTTGMTFYSSRYVYWNYITKSHEWKIYPSMRSSSEGINFEWCESYLSSKGLKMGKYSDKKYPGTIIFSDLDHVWPDYQTDEKGNKIKTEYALKYGLSTAEGHVGIYLFTYKGKDIIFETTGNNKDVNSQNTGVGYPHIITDVQKGTRWEYVYQAFIF